MNPLAPLDRRRFLKTGTRYLMLAGLGGLAVAGETKRRRLANDPNCIRLRTCADCVEFGDCPKPKAQNSRPASNGIQGFPNQTRLNDQVQQPPPKSSGY